MVKFVLIILIHTGVLSKNDSLSVGSVSGFSTQQECEQAGQAASALILGTVKQLRFVCVAQTGGQQ